MLHLDLVTVVSCDACPTKSGGRLFIIKGNEMEYGRLITFKTLNQFQAAACERTIGRGRVWIGWRPELADLDGWIRTVKIDDTRWNHDNPPAEQEIR